MTSPAAAVWVVLLASTALGPAHAYVTRAPLPRWSRDRHVSGARSLKCDATSPLIEATACRVLRTVLRNGREAHVSCKVESDALDLLQGKLRGASIKGRGWASRLGLTARTVDVDVGNVNLDVGALFRRRVLEFRTPSPSGDAAVVFNAQDFGNFLAHPLVRRTAIAGRSFVFDRGCVYIDPRLRVVEFGGTWGGQRVRVQLSQAAACERLVARLVRSGAGADYDGLTGEEVDAIAAAMGRFFNNLEIDLDGPKLSFSSLSFEGRTVTDGRLKLNLGIVVRKLPSIRTVASF